MPAKARPPKTPKPSASPSDDGSAGLLGAPAGGEASPRKDAPGKGARKGAVRSASKPAEPVSKATAEPVAAPAKAAARTSRPAGSGSARKTPPRGKGGRFAAAARAAVDAITDGVSSFLAHHGVGGEPLSTADGRQGDAGAPDLQRYDEQDESLHEALVRPSEPAHPGVPLSPPGIVPESDVRVHSPAAAMPVRDEHHTGEDLGELPSGYGDGRVVALVRDPSTLFVYWDLSPNQIEQAFSGLAHGRALLKVVDARHGAVIREVDIQLEARAWYLREVPPGSELRVELWAVGQQGARLVRSARQIRMPPSSPSDVHEEFYAVLPLGVALPRDGHIGSGRPFTWIAGSAPPGWERRLQPRPGAPARSGAGGAFINESGSNTVGGSGSNSVGASGSNAVYEPEGKGGK